VVVVYRPRRSLAEHDIAGIASLELNLDLQLLPLVLILLCQGLNNNLDTTHLSSSEGWERREMALVNVPCVDLAARRVGWARSYHVHTMDLRQR
jgi:hypothetical protein